MSTLRRAKWQPPPQPTPRILHLPRRSNLRKHPTITGAEKWKSGANRFLWAVAVLRSEERGRRGERSEEELENGGDDVEERESDQEMKYWWFEVEMLRVECKFLRMERDITVKKLNRERCLLDGSYNFALHTLLSGKKKIIEGKSGNSVIEEEIEELAKKLLELQRMSKVHGCASHSSKFNMFSDVENLRTKMKRLSKGKLLKKMEEEYGGFMLSATTNYSVPSSALTCRQYYDLPELSSFSFQLSPQEEKCGEPKTCSGQCIAIVRRIMEEVRAETEQWSQMQDMVVQLRWEMEELHASRDLLEERALQSDHKLKTLKSQVEKWKQKAVSLEIRESQVEKQVQELQHELDNSRMEKKISDSTKEKASKELVPLSLGVQLAKEKRLLTCRLKGNNNCDKQVVDYSDGKKTVYKYGRYPFKDISNMPHL